MGQRGGAAWLVVVATLAAPVAGAVAVEGDLVLGSGALFPPETIARLVAAGFLVDDTAAGVSIRLRAPEVSVHVVEARFLRVEPLSDVRVSSQERTWRLTDVEVDAIFGTPSDGYLAFDAAPGPTVAFETSTALTVHHPASTVLSSDGGAAMSLPDGEHPFYWRAFEGPHLRLESPGALHGSTSGVLKVAGLDLLVRSASNVTSLRTGREAGVAGEEVLRWVYLRFDRGELHVRSEGKPFQVVAAHAEGLGWSGVARVVALDGGLRSADVEYASPGPAHLEGDLTAALYPVPGERLRLAAIRGDLGSTSLAAHPRALSEPAPAPTSAALPVGAFLLGALVSAGAVVGARAYRVRAAQARRTPEETREDCLAWAAFFEEQEDAAAALECLRAARRYTDDDEYDLLLWEASCMDRLGRLDDAYAAYEAAVAVAPKGECEAAFAAAIVAGQLDRPEQALVHLRLSLMADPFLLEVLDAFRVSEEDPFGSLRRRPGFQQLVRDARAWARTARNADMR